MLLPRFVVGVWRERPLNQIEMLSDQMLYSDNLSAIYFTNLFDQSDPKLCDAAFHSLRSAQVRIPTSRTGLHDTHICRQALKPLNPPDPMISK